MENKLKEYNFNPLKEGTILKFSNEEFYLPKGTCYVGYDSFVDNENKFNVYIRGKRENGTVDGIGFKSLDVSLLPELESKLKTFQ